MRLKHWQRILLGAAVLLIVATGLKCVWNGVTENSLPCVSSRRARLWGIFVCKAEFHPAIIQWGGREIEIREAWVERASRVRHWLVWFPRREQLEGYRLCFSLHTGKEVFEGGASSPFWVMGNADHDFAWFTSPSGRMVFYDELNPLPSSVFLSLLRSPGEPRKQNILVAINPSDSAVGNGIPPGW
ncbi:MAG TPA: hypothetical protein VHY22_11415 [Chthoniobacteraceae bacterium]|jgi:hypothetical protein|nr:hypothetical protein [Chthoniobacteraceae bacterium]